MGQEIERKYLVRGDDFKEGISPVYIRQGFLNTEKDTVIRVRIYGDKGFLAVKASGAGIKRTEYEYEIPVTDASEILEKFCREKTIEKFRYSINYEGHTWEVDVFMKENSGLTIAEIELEFEDQPFSLPPWIGEEITGEPRYYNANLVNHPFLNW